MVDIINIAKFTYCK